MRKATQRERKETMAQFDTFEGRVMDDASVQQVPGGIALMRLWCASVRQDIEDGNLGPCTQAMVNSIKRFVRDCRDGRISDARRMVAQQQ